MEVERLSASSTDTRARSQTLDLSFLRSPIRSRTAPDRSHSKTASTTKLVPSTRAASTPPERLNDSPFTWSGHNATSLKQPKAELNRLRNTLSKKKSRYYEEAFANRGSGHGAKLGAVKDSLITAEIKISGCLDSVQEFLVDIAFLLSEIYQRPIGCIMVLVSTELTILFDNSQDSAYQISITALTTEIAAMKNKRVAGILREFMSENISIPARRGVVLFNSILNENMLAGELRDAEAFPYSGIRIDATTKVTKGQSSGIRTKLDVLRTATRSKADAEIDRSRASSFQHDKAEIAELDPTRGIDMAKQPRKRKSIMALFGF